MGNNVTLTFIAANLRTAAVADDTSQVPPRWYQFSRIIGSRVKRVGFGFAVVQYNSRINEFLNTLIASVGHNDIAYLVDCQTARI